MRFRSVLGLYVASSLVFAAGCDRAPSPPADVASVDDLAKPAPPGPTPSASVATTASTAAKPDTLAPLLKALEDPATVGVANALWSQALVDTLDASERHRLGVAAVKGAMRREISLERTPEEMALAQKARVLLVDHPLLTAFANAAAAPFSRRHSEVAFTIYERPDVKRILLILHNISPNAPAPLILLMHLAELDNEYAERVEYLQQLVAIAPDDENLRTLLVRAQTQLGVEGKFQRKHTDGHFEVQFEGVAQERVAYAALRILERAYFDVNQTLQLAPKNRFTVVIYTGGQYADAVGAPDWSGGAFDGKIRIREGDIIERGGQLEGLLTHEYIHAALFETSRKGIPVWFHEGVAQALSKRRGQTPDRNQLLRLARQRKLLHSYSTLEQSFAALQSPAQVHLAYAQALGFVEHLRRRHGDQGLATLLRKIRKGATFETAFERVYFQPPAALFATWEASL